MLSTSLHDMLEVMEWGDNKNGADMLLDEDNNIVFVVYGHTYAYKGRTAFHYYAYKILPIDEKRNFLDVSDVLLGRGGVKVAANQFE